MAQYLALVFGEVLRCSAFASHRKRVVIPLLFYKVSPKELPNWDSITHTFLIFCDTLQKIKATPPTTPFPRKSGQHCYFYEGCRAVSRPAHGETQFA